MGQTIKSNSAIQSKSQTECYIINNDTKDKLIFQFNPTSIPYSRSANYSTITSPGMSYPLTQYTSGNLRDFNLELFYYDMPYTGSIEEARLFLEDLLPPEKNKKSFKKPPTFTLAFGYFVKKCVLLELEVSDTMLNSDGFPLVTSFSLSVRQVGK